jgi:hypothetical protein
MTARSLPARSSETAVGVTKHVRRDSFGAKGGTVPGRSRSVFRDQSLDRVAAKPGCASTRERWVERSALVLGQPSSQDRRRCAGQRGAALLATFTAAAHVRSCGRKHNVLAAQVAELGDAQAGLEQQQEHGAISPTEPGREIRRGEQSVLLGAGQRGDELALGLLARNREDPLGDGAVGRLLQGDEAEERMDGGQASVSGANAIAPVRLEMLQERDDERSVEIGHEQSRRGLAHALLAEREEESERVAIRGDRVGACISLTQEAVGEERLEQPRDQRHGRTAEYRSRRAVAASSNSGTAVKYQYVDDGPTWPR